MTIIIMHIFKHTQILLQNIDSQKIVWKHQKTKVHGCKNWSGLDHGLTSFGSSILKNSYNELKSAILLSQSSFLQQSSLCILNNSS